MKTKTQSKLEIAERISQSCGKEETLSEWLATSEFIVNNKGVNRAPFEWPQFCEGYRLIGVITNAIQKDKAQGEDELENAAAEIEEKLKDNPIESYLGLEAVFEYLLCDERSPFEGRMEIYFLMKSLRNYINKTMSTRC